MPEEPFPLASEPGDTTREASAPTVDPPSLPDPAEEPGPSPLPFLVVGIGAAAGGLAAYAELLHHLAPDTGMAFVLVPHLNSEPQGTSVLSVLRHHAPMPVVVAEDGMRPEPNRMHVIPPDSWLTLENGTFRVQQHPPRQRVPTPVDHFFYSLAADQRNRAVGVILSGGDGDGALGLKTIKGEGGIAIVQDPATARVDSMPRAGILADHVDLILPPALIATELTRIGRQFAAPALRAPDQGELQAEDEQALTRIFALLRGVSGIDFRLYKHPTLRRRILRRMLLKRLDSLPEYAQFVQGNPPEVRSLHEDVLINVTRFFRDQDVFAALSELVLPHLLRQRAPDAPLRIWVAGCSTGEEVYSIAIVLLELLGGVVFEPAIQIFGTDASERSIEKARAAIYPDSIANEISPERLRRFFVKVDQGYQIAKRIRDLCVFARQNLCNDPPFSKLDLVSCRNVLIYLGPELQRSIIPTFHYALNPDGALLLGSSETIREYSDLFTVLDRKNKIYARNPAAARLAPDLVSRAVPPRLPDVGSQLRAAGKDGWSELELQRAADRIVLTRYGPAGVIINDRMEILQSRGHMGSYLEMAQGSASLHLLRMAREELVAPLRGAVQRAIDHDVPVQVPGVMLQQDGRELELLIDVLPIPHLAEQPRCFLVLFAPAGQRPARQPDHLVAVPPPEESGDEQVARLTRDLASTRMYLQALLEERDARNQELTSANEEIQSTNEELQSINEEMETAKEELQSTNEELHTVNEELHTRNTELSRSSNDLINLLNSVNLPVLMLGSDLRIRHFTPLTGKLMNVRPTDVGRPIREIRLGLSVDDLEPMLQEVIDTLGTGELDVQDRHGKWHLLRARPYRTADNKIEGVVMVLLDVDQLRRSQQAVETALEFAQSVVQGVPVPLVVLGSDLRIRMANGAFRAIANLPDGDAKGRYYPELTARLWKTTEVGQQLEELVRRGPGAPPLDAEYTNEEGTGRTLHIRARLLQPDGEYVVLLTQEDVTLQRRAEKLLQSENKELAGQVQVTERALGRTRDELRALTASLFSAQEDERRRVARELHDDLVQQVALVQMAAEHAERVPALPAAAREQLMDLLTRTGTLATDLRRIAHQLHPSHLDLLGLPTALESLVEEFGERENMPVLFQRRHLPGAVPRDMAAALYRITQEALRNVTKHAGRTHVKVSLEGLEPVDGAGARVRLTVRDFGEGFDAEAMRTGGAGLGLLSMEERARLLGGMLEVWSQLGEGTTVSATMPLPVDGIGGTGWGG